MVTYFGDEVCAYGYWRPDSRCENCKYWDKCDVVKFKKALSEQKQKDL